MTKRSTSRLHAQQHAQARPRRVPFRRLRSRPTHLTWSVLVAFGMVSSQALANPSIAIDNRTGTQVIESAPGVFDIHTTTVRGANGFNSFQHFNVGSGQIANLHLASGTANLINLVRDGRTTIDGMLNAFRDGKIGGNVYFANPNGFIVSASGVVNVGSLHISTPTHSFIDNFFDGTGNPNDAATALLLGGKAPRNALGVITLDGQVNAIGDVVLSAGAINVGGAIFSDAQFVTNEPLFTDVVNATGLTSATGVVERDGRIEIVADHNVRIAGTAGSGAHRVEGGLVSITSGGQIELLDGAYVGATNDVALSATQSGGELDVVSDTNTSITLNNATVRGRNVTLEASSSHASSISPLVTKTVSAQIDVVSSTLEASGNLTLSATTDVDVTTPSISPVGTVDVESIAGVDVSGTSTLSSGGDTRLTASSTVKAVVKPGLPDFGTHAGDAGVAVVVIDSRATSDLRGQTTANATGALDVTATNTVDVEAVTDASAAGSTAVGGTVSVAVVDTTTRAAITENARVTSAASVNVSAESINRVIVSATASAAGANGKGAGSSKTEETLADYQDEASTSDGGVTVAAAVAVSDLTSRTEATLASSEALSSSGAVDVRSLSLNQADVLADGSSVDGGTGVGAGVAINLVDSLNQAGVYQRVSATSLDIEADLPAGGDINRFHTEARSGAGASNVGVAGSLAVTVIENRSTARYGFGGSAPGGSIALGPLRVSARNESDTETTAAPLNGGATGDTVGIGASVAVHTATNDTLAEIADGAVLTDAGNITLQATGKHATAVSAEAGAAGGIGVTPVTAIAVVDNATAARIGTGAVLNANGDVALSATHSGTTTTSATADAAGEKAAIGAAVAITMVSDAVSATTARSITASGEIGFAAHGDATSSSYAKASAKGGKNDNTGNTQDDGVDQEIGKQLSLGKDRQATGSNAGQTPASAETAGEDGNTSKVSVAAAISVNVAESEARASVLDGANIQANSGALTLSASGNTDASATADGSAVGDSAVGIGAAVAINTATANTVAYLGAGTHAVQGLSLEAGMTDTGGDTTNTFASQASSGAGSGKVGVAGSLALNVIDTRSVASLSETAEVDAGQGDVTLSADNATSSTVRALPAEDVTTAGSKLGIGASVAVNVVSNESRAELTDGAKLTDGNHLVVTAKGDYASTTEAEAGSEGGVSVTPVAAVSVIDNLTIARLGTGDGLNLDGNVTVQATHDSQNTTTAKGSSKGDKAAVGIAVAVSVANDSALATTERDITADGSMRFASLMSQSSTTSATASAKGGKEEKKTGAADDTPDDGVDKEVSKQASFGQTKQRDTSTTKTKTPESAQTSEGKVSVAAAVGVTASDVSSEASIADGVTIVAGQAVTVEASGNTNAKTTADGSAAGSTAMVGIGAGVAINSINADTHAWIGNAAITSNGVTVQTSMTDKGGDTTNTFESEAKSGGGSGKIGIAGSVALNIIDQRSIAEVASGANINAGNGDVVLSAASDTASTAQALPAEGAGSASNEKVGIGASVAVNVVSNETRAELRDGATLTGGDDLTVQASGKYAATTKAEAGSAGGISLTPVAAVSVVDNQTIARLGSGNALDVSGNVIVEATHSSTNITEAKGSSKGETAAIGIAVAVAVTNDSALATTARNLDADGSVRFAAYTSQSSDTKATASAKGGKAEQKTGAADDTPDDGVDQEVDKQASFGQSKQRTDSSTKTQKPGSAQTSEGKVSVAAAVGVTAADVRSEASIGDGLTIAAGQGLTVEASGNTDAKTSADGSSAGSTAMVGVGAGVAINSINADTHAWIGNNAKITANGLTVRSFMTEMAGDKVNTIDASAKAGAAGGKVGIAGALALNLVDVRNTAEIRDGVTIDADAGNVVVSADTATKTTASALPDQPATGGKVGVGASVALNLFGEEITRARIGSGVTLGDANDLRVSAAAQSDTTATAEAGAAGSVAIDAVVAMSDLKLQTEAVIASGSSIAADGDVEISAVSSGTHTATATGDVKSDKVGIGASAAIILSNTSTRAALDSNLRADGDLTVHAGATRTYEAVAKASAGGGKSEDEMSQSEKGKASSTSTLKKTESQQQRGTNVASQAESDRKDKSEDDTSSSGSSAGAGASGGGGKLNAAAAAGVMIIDDNASASIAANRRLDVGGDLTVRATNSSDFSARGLGDAIDVTKLTGGAKVGIGVGVGIAIVDNNTEASIGDGTTIVRAGDVSVQAESKQNTNPAFANKLAAEGLAGAGSEKVSVAGALALVLSDGSTQASIGDNVTIQDAGDIRITADNTSKLSAKAWSVATSGKVGVGASVAVLVAENEYQAWLGQGADVTANSLAVAARNHEINGPVSFDWSLDGLQDRFTEANLQILLGQNNYYTEAIAGAAAGNVALSGAFSVNIFDDTTQAWVGEGATLRTTGALDLTASNETTAKAFAGGVAASKKVGVGLASASIANDGVTRAWLADDVQVLQAGSVSLNALSSMDLAVIGASAGLAGKAGIAGVANVIHSQNLVEASLGNNVTLNSNGTLALSAENAFEALNVAGVAGVGGTAGVGVSAGVNIVDNQTRASIGDDGTISAAGAASIDAESSVDVLSVVVGGAGGGKVGVAASAATNIFTPVTEASIGDNTLFNATAPLLAQSVRVSADSATDLLSVVGTVGVGGTAGVGGAADIVVIDKHTKAWIGRDSVVRAAQNIAVLAESHETIRSNGVGFAAGGTAGVQGSASVVVLTTDTQAWADDNTELHSNGNIVIAAGGSSDLNLVAGAATAGGTAAVGAGAAVAVIDKTTHAWIGDNASVTALGNAAAANVETGEFTVNYTNAAAGEGEVAAPGVTPSNGENDLSGGSEALQKSRGATSKTTSLQGLAITAVNQDSIKGFAVTGAAAGTAAVTLSGEVGVHNTTTSASIGNNTKVNENNADANAAQSVLVAAGNDSFHLGVAGALSVAGTVGVGVGADVSVMSHDTHASIGNNTTVNARKDVSVQASSAQEVVSVSTSLGASGTVGVAGSVSVLHFDNETWAWIGNGATVDAGGNVAVNASDDTSTTLIVGGVGVGISGGGAGAGVGVTIIDKDTRAWVGNNATVDARGQNTSNLTGFSGTGFNATESLRGLRVQALSSEDLFTAAAAGGAGLYVGLAGAVSVATIDSDTLAYLGNGVRVNTNGGSANAAQDVNVTARNDLSLFNVTGALGLGAAGIAGAVDVGVIRNDTTAFIGDNAVINAARDVDVSALSNKDIETYVVSAAGGLAAIAAGIGVYSVGGALDGDSRGRLDTDDGDSAGAYADQQATDSSITDSFLADYDDDNVRNASAKVRTARNGTGVSSRFTANESRDLPSGNAAFIGESATINAGRNVTVNAREFVDFDMTTGALAIGAVGLGAGVGVANFMNNNLARVHEGAKISAGNAGTFGVNAQLVENLNALSIAGTGGIVAVDAAVAVLQSNGSVTAEIEDATTVERAELITVKADDDRALHAETTGVSVGAVAAGASVSTATIGGSTQALIGDDANIGNGGVVGGIMLDASANHAATAKARAAKGGLGLAASGTVSTATIKPTVTASIGTGGDIDVSGNVVVQADAAVAARAESLGINVSAGAALGASVAVADVAPLVTASVGSNTSIDAGNITVQAKQSLPSSGRSAYAKASGASGGLLLGANATWSEATNTGIVKAMIGNGSILNTAGAVKVAALNVNSQLSDVAGFSGGLVAVGANFAHAGSNTLTEAELGNLVKVTAGSLEVSATGNSTNHAHGIAGSGGLVSAPFSEASTSTISRTFARTGTGSGSSNGQNARDIDVGTLLVNAQQTSEFNSWMRNTNASLVGVSGAKASNFASARTEAHLGEKTQAEADNIVLSASNSIFKRNLHGTTLAGSDIAVPEWNVNSSSGGLVDVPAGESTTTITTNALTQVGTNTYLTQSGDRFNPGNFKVDAFNQVDAFDKVKMASGGAVSAASGVSRIIADNNNATIRIGNGSKLNSVGDIRMGARALATLHAQAAVDIWGAVGVAPYGESVARFRANNTVDIESGVEIESLNDIRLSAGANSDGATNSLSSTARSDVFNNTAIPVNRDPVADAIIETQSNINIADGAAINAVRHVMLYAEKGSATASGVGIGKDLWREALAAVANAFGADVSFETRTGRSIANQGANVVVDGDVRVGIHRKQWLKIDANGVVTHSDGMKIVKEETLDIGTDILKRIADLEELIRNYSVDNSDSDAAIAVEAYRSEIRFLESKLLELGFERGEDGSFAFYGEGQSNAEMLALWLNSLNETLADFAAQRASLAASTSTLQSQNQSLNGQISTEEGNITGWRSERDSLNPEENADRIAELNGFISTAETNITNHRASIDANLDVIAENNQKIQQIDDDVQPYEERKTDVIAMQNEPEDPPEHGNQDERVGPTATYLTVGDAVARLGNIYVRADNLTGNGVLDAPGDAEIRIDNHSSNFLVLNSLTIPPDVGGRVYFNSVDVESNADIETINRSRSANFDIFTAADQPNADDRPRIVISSHFNPLNLGSAGANIPAPDIILQGDISNLRGLVQIDSAAGSIRLEQKRDEHGNILPETANIRADEIQIMASNGDFVQSYTDSFFHVAGTPLQVTPGDEELDFPDNVSSIGYSPEAATSGIVANGSVIIAARYLNINGTIQSGIAEWGVSIPENATVLVDGNHLTFEQARAHFLSLGSPDGGEYFTVSGTSVIGADISAQQIGVRYNAKEDRLELNGVQVQGGYIELFGEIMNTNNTGGAKLRVLDGYGQIQVDNQSGRALLLNTLDSGRGVNGQINISNIRIGDDGKTNIVTTTFTREADAARTGYAYNPDTGLRYSVSVGYNQMEEHEYVYSEKRWFGSRALSEGVNLDQFRINSIVRENDPLLAGEFLVRGNGGQPHHTTDTQTFDTGDELVMGNSWKRCGFLCIRPTYYQRFFVFDGSKTVTTDTVRADYPIAIEYIGFDEGKINVSSVGDVILNGSLTNRGGDTFVQSSEGSILRGADDLVLVGGNNITLDAANGIGTQDQAVQLNAKGVLNALSSNGIVNVQQMVGDLKVGTIGGANVSHAIVTSARDILGANADSLIQGHRVQLQAENGKIGDLTGNSPLQVSTGYSTNQADWHKYGLKATARGDIDLENVAQGGVFTGDLLLVAIESQAGDVRIQTAGNAIDNNPYETTDTRTEAELAALWDSMRLRGSGADEKADEAVAAFENGKSNNYALYWQLRALQEDGGASYDEGFAYSVSDAERAALTASGLDAAAISGFEDNRTSQYHQLHAEVGGLSESYQEGFTYVATAEEEASIRKGAKWSDEQLILSVGAGLLKNTTSTVTTIKDANIIGRNIELIAGGDIGSFNPQMEIDLSAGLDQLTIAQRAALAAVERGDAVFDGSIIRLNQWRPVNVATGSGNINASSGGLVFLGSQGDLRIDQITAAGGSRIKVAGSIINAATDPALANVTTSSLILEAANGGIGSTPDEDGEVEKALKVNITSDDGIIARAANNIWIEADSDLNVDTMYSRGDIRLDATGSILDFQDDGTEVLSENNIRARNVYLSSTHGSIGTANNALEIGVNADGAITASTQAVSQGVYLNGPAGEYFNIASVQSGDAVELSSATTMRINGVVAGPGPISLVAGGEMILSQFADVHSVVGGAQLRASELLMLDDGTHAARLRSDTGTIAITTTEGDATITGIETGNGTANAVRITSAGDILDGGDTRVMDIIANATPDATLTLVAAGSIGTGNALEIDVSKLNASTGGALNLVVANSIDIGTIDAQEAVEITARLDITGNSITSHTDKVELHSIAGNLHVADITVATGAFLHGDQISATVWGTGLAPIGGSMTGYAGTAASNIDVKLSSRSGFDFDTVSMRRGAINMLLGDLWINDLFVGNRATITNAATRMLIDQDSRTLQGYDVQLYPEGRSFAVGLSRNLIDTDAFVIGRSPDHQTVTPDRFNLSSVEATERSLSVLLATAPSGPPPEAPSFPELVAFSGSPVSLDEDAETCEAASSETSCE